MEKIKSFAYCSNIGNKWNDEKDVVSLDLLAASPFKKKQIVENFNKLKRFRFTNCYYVKEIIFKNCPELECIEGQNCETLTNIKIENCPNIKTLDFSNSTSLKEISGLEECKQIEYISLFSTNLSHDLPKMETLLYLDLHCNDNENENDNEDENLNINHKNIDFKLFPNLEEYKGDPKEVHIEDLLEHEHLINVYLNKTKIIIDSKEEGGEGENKNKIIKKPKSLQFLILSEVEINKELKIRNG